LLRLIQQQRLDLSASHRHWIEATAPIDRGWNTFLNLRSWAMVGSGIVAIWSVRHPRFLMRWAKRSLGIWSTWRMARNLLRSPHRAKANDRVRRQPPGQAPPPSGLPLLAHQQISPFSVCRHFAQHRLYDPLQPPYIHVLYQ
jgi:hypothetical protein